MSTAVEHLYESCTCDSGMRDGLRCADCGGRGIVVKGVKPTGDTIPEPTDESADFDDLENLDVKALRKRASDLGLSSGGSKEALVARIRDLNTAAAAEQDAAHTASDEDVDTEA